MHGKRLLVTEIGTMRQDAMKSSVKAVLAVDVGGSSVKSSPRDRAKRASIIFIRADADAQANGFGSQEARRRLDV